MKKLLLFYILLSFVHSFSAAAAEKSPPHRAPGCQGPFVAAFHKVDSQRLKNAGFERFSFFKKDSNQDSSSEFGFKRKATELKFAELPAVYRNNLYLIKQYSGREFFGLTNLFSISLHAYLHLYQLF